MLAKDLPACTELYLNFMYDSLYAQLGYKFVYNLLTGLCQARSELSYVCVEAERIIGFITVSVNSQQTTRELLWGQGWKLGLHALLACLKKPALFNHLLNTFRYFQQTGEDPSAQAEMIFITVDPDFRRQRVGERLIVKALREYWLRGAKAVKVTTVDDNLGVQLLLQKLGFTKRGTFCFYGKTMALFSRSL